MVISLNDYALSVQRAVVNFRCLDDNGVFLEWERAFDRIIQVLTKTKANGKKLLFIGNGGSATIASHMAEDFSKVAGIRAIAFNDGALLTCLANDYSFAECFEKAIEIYGDYDDVLFAVSSSGKSPNILKGAEAAKKKNCFVITLSGFNRNNPLLRLGGVNVHVPSHSYGIVENSHALIIHYLLDYVSGKLTDTLIRF